MPRALDGADMRTVLTWVDRRQALPAQQALAGRAGPRHRAGPEPPRRHRPHRRARAERHLVDRLGMPRRVPLRRRPSQATSEPDFDPPAFVGSADTVYIAAPAHQQAAVAPMVVGLIEDLRRAAYARARRRAPTRAGRSARLLALDELANIAPLPDLPAMVSEGGGQGLVTLACFQDLSQARHRWPGPGGRLPLAVRHDRGAARHRGRAHAGRALDAGRRRGDRRPGRCLLPGQPARTALVPTWSVAAALSTARASRPSGGDGCRPT